MRLIYQFEFNMYAIIKTGGKQYRVQSGDKLSIEKLAADVGQTVTLDQVISVVNGTTVTLGAPFVKNASVELEVLRQYRDDKIIIFKKKRRQNYRRRNGHRQHLTQVVVKNVVAG